MKIDLADATFASLTAEISHDQLVPPKTLEPYEIEVKFGPAIASDAQGRSLLAFERYLRETLGVPATVYKEVMADDSKRRRDMTPDERKRL